MNRAIGSSGMVSPSTRGWTLVTVPSTRAGFGFPAHAGMDLNQHVSTDSVYRFPRPRGDGPAPHPAQNAIPSVSPPTRGWTLLPSADGGP